jgi:hypothetical protein
MSIGPQQKLLDASHGGDLIPIDQAPSKPTFVRRSPAPRIVLIWFSGFFLALLLVLIIADSWISPYQPYVWEPELGRFVVAPGRYRAWDEGDGVTQIGRYGVAAIPDVRDLKTDSVLLWGDSFVEAMQVDDDQKMAQVLTRSWNVAHPDSPLTAVGVGMRGWSFADIYFQIAKFEKLVPQVRAHFLVLEDINDLEPDQEVRENRFVTSPDSPSGYAFVSSSWTPPAEEMKQFLCVTTSKWYGAC